MKPTSALHQTNDKPELVVFDHADNDSGAAFASRLSLGCSLIRGSVLSDIALDGSHDGP
jgi:hypothetical protein